MLNCVHVICNICQCPKHVKMNDIWKHRSPRYLSSGTFVNAKVETMHTISNEHIKWTQDNALTQKINTSNEHMQHTSNENTLNMKHTQHTNRCNSMNVQTWQTDRQTDVHCQCQPETRRRKRRRIKGRDRVGHWLSTPANRPLSGALGRRPGVLHFWCVHLPISC